jgi:hypothetical protein
MFPDPEPDQACVLLKPHIVEEFKRRERPFKDRVERHYLDDSSVREFEQSGIEPGLTAISSPADYHRVDLGGLIPNNTRLVPLRTYQLTNEEVVCKEVIQEEKRLLGGVVIFLKLQDSQSADIPESVWTEEEMAAVRYMTYALRYPENQRRTYPGSR